MQLGLFLQPESITTYVEAVKKAADQGFHSVWSPQIFGADALTAIAVAGREVPNINFGTAVIPTYPRHPAMMAQHALTVTDAIGPRLTLGLGLSHQVVIEGMYGMSFDKPGVHMREYLNVLVPALNERTVNVSGEAFTFRGPVQVPSAPTPKLMIAALAPMMLGLAGSMTDGTILWMTGPTTIREHINPVMHAAAAQAGRPTPSTIVGLPVCLTDDVDRAKERAAKDFAIYGQLPSYRAVLDREGAAGPADIAIIGDEAAIAEGVRKVADAGATELCANVFGSADERARTQDFLATLL